tara:strand:- start:1181 stop:1492 length:312 start_codon:yes stop_codon:yes gene_type:complete
MEQATMVYKHPGKHKIHGGLFDYKIVSGEAEEEDGESQLDQALSDGWFLTTTEAKEGTPSDDQAPTRAELEAKAVELEISFPSNIGDAKLLEKIEAALEAKGD